jgi:hypothetical protein
MLIEPRLIVSSFPSHDQSKCIDQRYSAERCLRRRLEAKRQQFGILFAEQKLPHNTIALLSMN